MDRIAILRKIDEIIADLQEQTERFALHTKPIDAIELELFIANSKFLSDHALILQKINQAEAPTAPEEKTVIGILEDLPELEDELPEPDVEVLEEPVYTHMPVSEPIQEPVLTEIIAEQVEEVVEIRVHQETITETAIADTVKPTLNDLMGSKTEHNLATRFSQEPVKDLKSIINLNDKMLFVKDLFSGYSLAYQEAIDTLNRLEDFQSADQYLKTNYIEKYKWSEQSNTADRFYELLNRRFAK